MSSRPSLPILRCFQQAHILELQLRLTRMLQYATDDFFRHYLPFQPTDAHIEAAIQALKRADVLRCPGASACKTKTAMAAQVTNVPDGRPSTRDDHHEHKSGCEWSACGLYAG
jgi:hypothetical protein